jgi:hypothetical protein
MSIYENLGEKNKSIFPMNIKIFSKLNKKDVIIEYYNMCESLKVETPSINIDVTKSGVDIIKNLEDKVIDKIVDDINKKLEHNNKLIITSLVENVVPCMEHFSMIKLTVDTKYKVIS